MNKHITLFCNFFQSPITGKVGPSGLAPGDMGYFTTLSGPGSSYISALKYNSLAAFQKATTNIGKGLVMGAIATAGLTVAPTVTMGALVGATERATSDAQKGKTSTMGQLVTAGAFGGITAGLTGPSLLKTLIGAGLSATAGGILLDGSVQPGDVASSIIAVGAGKAVGAALSTPQTSQLVKAAVSGATEVVTSAAAGAITTKQEKKG